MKIRKKTAVLAAVLAACFMLSVLTFAADSAYDSTKDPIVAKSYVDAKVSELNSTTSSMQKEITALNTENAALKTELTSLKSDVAALKKELASLKNSAGSTGSGATYVVVNVKRGETIYAKGGAVELILRTGSAVVVSPFTTGSTKQGLSDSTKGIEIYNGESVTVNDLLLIPRGGDGRGIKITSGDAYVMVRGDYEIK